MVSQCSCCLYWRGESGWVTSLELTRVSSKANTSYVVLNKAFTALSSVTWVLLSYITDKETEAQRDEVSFQRDTAEKQQGYDLNTV